MRLLPKTLLIFLVTLCLGQVVWWVFFALAETGRTAEEKREVLRGRCYQALVLLHRASMDQPVPKAWEEIAPRFPGLELLEPRDFASQDPARPNTKAPEKAPAFESEGPIARGEDLVPPGAPLARFQVRATASALAAISQETRRKRRMFYWEGGSLTALVIMGVLLLYRTLRNDIEIRKGHQRFLAGATHELKTPLSSLKLALETLQTGAVSPERAETFYGNMLLEVERLQNQIENLLETASLQKRPTCKKKVDLAGIIEEIVAEQRPRFLEKDLDLRCELRADRPLVKGDEAALRQLLLNLIDNARLYSPQGGKVHLRLVDRDHSIFLRIHNSGEGIPEEERGKVFDRFFRGKDTKETGGSGLGLYLARRVALDHGGTLDLLAPDGGQEEEGGATFVLELPRMRTEP